MTDLRQNENPNVAAESQTESSRQETPPPATPAPVAVPPRRRGRMRNRLLAGGLIAGVIALAMFFGGLFDGLGLGAGSGGGLGLGNDRKSADSKKQKTNLIKQTPRKNEEKLRGDVVEVQLDGNRYQLRRTDGTVISKPVSIAEIVKRAGKAKGDDRRVRVRVFLRYNADLSSRDALQDALEKSGLSSNDIAVKKLDH